MRLLCCLASFITIGTGLLSEVNRPEPIYNPLPNTETILEALFNLDPLAEGYLPIPFQESLEGKWPATQSNFYQDPGVQASQEHYNQLRASPKSDLNAEPSIPRLIHLIWLGSEPTLAVNFAINSWKKHHPTWEIKVWRDEDISNFPWSTDHSREFFEKAGNWAEKSDILRFEILYQYGGIYSDTDVICLKSFEDLVSSGISFFAGYESNMVKRFGRPLVGSALIGSKKQHSILTRCMDFSLTVDQAPTTRQYIRSGPGPITKACYEALESGNHKDVIIFPCSFFYPLHWEARLEPVAEVLSYIRPESFSIHLWEGSWYDSFGNITE